MMTQIYAEATNVVVWLGHRTAVPVLEMLKTLDPNFQPQSSSGEVATQLESKIIAQTKRHIASRTRQENETIRQDLSFELTRLPWFTRTWVIQEVAVARRAIIQMGEWTFSWESLCQAFATLSDVHQMNGVLGPVNMINKIRTDRARKLLCPDLLDLLQRFRHCEATDKRDKVYALLGLACSSTAGKRSVKVASDYRKSVSGLYTFIAIQYIKLRRDLEILSHVVLDASLNKSWPSWVPDWSQYHLGLSPLPKYRKENHSNEPHYKCGGSLTLNYEFLSDADLSFKRLVLEGFVYDTVISVGNVAMSAEDLGLGGPHRAAGDFRIIQDWKRMSEKARVMYKSDTDCAFWRTLVADVIGGDRIGRNNLEFATLAAWVVWNGFSTTSEEKLSKSNEVRFCVAALKRAVVRRTFIITQKGYMGLGPAYTQPGDKIYVLAGGQVPFILRPTENIGVFSLVGECYVHGIMDGEATEEGIDRETVCII
jgi:hypothetical protein